MSAREVAPSTADVGRYHSVQLLPRSGAIETLEALGTTLRLQHLQHAKITLQLTSRTLATALFQVEGRDAPRVLASQQAAAHRLRRRRKRHDDFDHDKADASGCNTAEVLRKATKAWGRRADPRCSAKCGRRHPRDSGSEENKCPVTRTNENEEGITRKHEVHSN